MKLRWQYQAGDSLRRARAFIEADNPEAARNVFDRVLRSVALLREFPTRGRVGRLAGTRELVIPGLPYIVVYRVTAEAVEILDVLHSSREWPESVN